MEDDTRILQKYAGPVLRELEKIRDERKLASVCRDKLGGLQPGRLTELITGKRDLTFYYLSKLIDGGVVTVEQILQGKKIKELPQADQDIVNRLLLDKEEIRLIALAKERGFNLLALIKAMVGE